VAKIASDAIELCLAGTGGDWRRVARGEWGLTLEAGGWPLDVGLALRAGVLRVQAAVCEPGLLDPHDLLHRNRRLAYVRFTHTRAGDVWVQADLPEGAVDAVVLDRVLGVLVDAAQDARYAASASRRARSR